MNSTIIMSMALLTKIERTGTHPSAWELTTSKNKKIYVLFEQGNLSCRLNSKHIGVKVFNRDLKNRKAYSYMDTMEMLKLTQFKLKHTYPDEPAVDNGVKP